MQRLLNPTGLTDKERGNIMRGKLVEDLKYVLAISPALRNTAATLYNGSAVSVSNNGIDTRDYDEINFVANLGTFVGAPALDLVIVGSSTDNPSGASIVSGNASPSDTASTNAAFTTSTTANDAQLRVGSIKCEQFNRYMWVRSAQAAATTYYGVTAVLGKGDRDPSSNLTVEFDLNY